MPTERMYSESVMRESEHKLCSLSKPLLHARFSARRATSTDNSAMATDVDRVNKDNGKRIAGLRAARGWTQKDLAERTGWRQADEDEGRAKGISPSRLGNYEQGTRTLGVVEAEMLATAFGDFPSAYFMGVIDEREALVIQAMRHPPSSPKKAAGR